MQLTNQTIDHVCGRLADLELTIDTAPLVAPEFETSYLLTLYHEPLVIMTPRELFETFYLGGV